MAVSGVSSADMAPPAETRQHVEDDDQQATAWNTGFKELILRRTAHIRSIGELMTGAKRMLLSTRAALTINARELLAVQPC